MKQNKICISSTEIRSHTGWTVDDVRRWSSPSSHNIDYSLALILIQILIEPLQLLVARDQFECIIELNVHLNSVLFHLCGHNQVEALHSTSILDCNVLAHEIQTIELKFNLDACIVVLVHKLLLQFDIHRFFVQLANTTDVLFVLEYDPNIATCKHK